MNRLVPAVLPCLAALAAGLPATAQTPELVVYTYDSFVTEYGPGPKIEEAFEAQCGCELTITAAGDGAALLSRVRLEGARSEADVVLGLDTNLMAAAKETGLFAAHGLETPPLDVPGGWADDVFLPYDWGHFAFVYDETRLAAPPTSFEALAEAPEDVTIVIQDPRTSTPGLGLLLWVKQVYGEDAAAYWEKLRPRVVTVTKGWWEAYSAFLDGEAMMALSYTTSPAYHAIAEGDETKKAAPFEEGHYMQVEVAGILASTDQPDLARDFMAFMLSPDFQSVIPTTNWMYPAVTPPEGLPEGFDGLVEPARSLLYAPEEAVAAREAALAEWLDVMSR
jgi:thiamine transport system substrate-binding protein